MKIIPHMHEVEFMPETRQDAVLIGQLARVLKETGCVRAKTVRDVRDNLPSLIISEVELAAKANGQ